MRKGFNEWLLSTKADVICLQETKASPEQVDTSFLEEMGYEHHWFSAQKKGYSSVAIFTKQKPDHIELGMGIDKYDAEGRVIRIDLGEISIISAYFPSGSSGDLRQAFKIQFLEDFFKYIKKLKKKRPNLIICGDYNICHREIDIHNPKTNKNTSGFKPEEREWMSKFFDSGFVDTFRHFHDGPHNYSWWSYRANARANNKGWRIDYISTSESLKDRLVSADIFPDAKHSDHCPVFLEIDA